MQAEELEDCIAQTYNPNDHKGVAEYIDKFQTWMEELDALCTRKFDNEEKKNMLLWNLQSDYRLLTLVHLCRDDKCKDFDATANYIREYGTSLD